MSDGSGGDQPAAVVDYTLMAPQQPPFENIITEALNLATAIQERGEQLTDEALQIILDPLYKPQIYGYPAPTKDQQARAAKAAAVLAGAAAAAAANP